MKEGGLRLEDEVGKERKGKKVWFPSRAVERARVFGPVLQIRSLPFTFQLFLACAWVGTSSEMNVTFKLKKGYLELNQLR